MKDQDRKDTILDSTWTRLEMEEMHITSGLLHEACDREYSLEECAEWIRQVDTRWEQEQETSPESDIIMHIDPAVRNAYEEEMVNPSPRRPQDDGPTIII
jgi:hypothetical protein